MYNVVKEKMTKWIHTASCPPIREYGGNYKLSKYCICCLGYVLMDSSSDWRRFSYVKRILQREKTKVRSLQNLCTKVIIEENFNFEQLPDSLRAQIRELKEQ